MGLIIEKAKIRNTEIDIENVYVRLQYVALANGVNCIVNLTAYPSKELHTSLKLVETNIDQNLNVSCPDGQPQNIDVVHGLVKTALEEKGFVVTIDL